MMVVVMVKMTMMRTGRPQRKVIGSGQQRLRSRSADTTPFPRASPRLSEPQGCPAGNDSQEEVLHDVVVVWGAAVREKAMMALSPSP
jgi:hypothetical protein